MAENNLISIKNYGQNQPDSSEKYIHAFQNINRSPFYIHPNGGRLFKMDAVEWLKQIESETVDLIFADPPYNIHKAEWDSFESQQEYID